jgi:hypothetical protein
MAFINLIAGVIGCGIILFKYTWIKITVLRVTETVFSPIAFGVAIATLLIGLTFFAILIGIAVILDKTKAMRKWQKDQTLKMKL